MRSMRKKLKKSYDISQKGNSPIRYFCGSMYCVSVNLDRMLTCHIALITGDINWNVGIQNSCEKHVKTPPNARKV